MNSREQDFHDMEERSGGGGGGVAVVGALGLFLVAAVLFILFVRWVTDAPYRDTQHRIGWGAAIPFKHAARRGSGGAEVTPPVLNYEASHHR